ncbi:hypothetical protein ZIOFF_055879 [Zingiber officinale]|uniref:Uncharacterized protein n=1 Tax=Zingiber officinale TaxID=94328 RepID=A0A8J5KKP1_ZINOF|nr:hypothetical protein ZIOFF_055879 [Zingiber officinale]
MFFFGQSIILMNVVLFMFPVIRVILIFFSLVSLSKCCLVKLFNDALLKEIKVMVVRHPDTLTMEIIKAGNKGYAAEILVVTYNRHTEDVDDESKLRILLVSSMNLHLADINMVK